MPTLDEICETYERAGWKATESGQPEKPSHVAMLAVLRKHVEPLIAEAYLSGMTGGPHNARAGARQEANGYAARLIAALTEGS